MHLSGCIYLLPLNYSLLASSKHKSRLTSWKSFLNCNIFFAFTPYTFHHPLENRPQKAIFCAYSCPIQNKLLSLHSLKKQWLTKNPYDSTTTIRYAQSRARKKTSGISPLQILLVLSTTSRIMWRRVTIGVGWKRNLHHRAFNPWVPLTTSNSRPPRWQDEHDW